MEKRCKMLLREDRGEASTDKRSHMVSEEEDSFRTAGEHSRV